MKFFLLSITALCPVISTSLIVGANELSYRSSQEPNIHNRKVAELRLLRVDRSQILSLESKNVEELLTILHTLSQKASRLQVDKGNGFQWYNVENTKKTSEDLSRLNVVEALVLINGIKIYGPNRFGIEFKREKLSKLKINQIKHIDISFNNINYTGAAIKFNAINILTN